jgi:hypothetical protein
MEESPRAMNVLSYATIAERERVSFIAPSLPMVIYGIMAINSRKEVIMRRTSYLKWFCLFLLILFFLPLSSLAAKEKSLVGEETLYFSLPSTQDRLISYLNDYYGKHHLSSPFSPPPLLPSERARWRVIRGIFPSMTALTPRSWASV